MERTGALEGEHYCGEHQGNTSHYHKDNCKVCKLVTEVLRLKQERDVDVVAYCHDLTVAEQERDDVEAAFMSSRGALAAIAYVEMDELSVRESAKAALDEGRVLAEGIKTKRARTGECKCTRYIGGSSCSCNCTKCADEGCIRSVERYLWISSIGAVFPCNTYELKLTFKHSQPVEILEKWPSSGHGPEFPFDKHTGVIVLDLRSKDPIKPLRLEEVEALCT
jgi:hypothetical protein